MTNLNLEPADELCVDNLCVGWDNQPIVKEEIPEEWYDAMHLYTVSATSLAEMYGLDAPLVNRILERYGIIFRDNSGWRYNAERDYKDAEGEELQYNGRTYVRYTRRMEKLFGQLIDDMLSKS